MLLEYAQLSLRAFACIFTPRKGPRGWRLSWKVSALFAQMVRIGVASLPTVTLANFLLGVVLAIQGAGQFDKLGATDMVADLVAFSVLREIGPLITAVIVIGRSGSSITAELGTMAVSEEIDALNVMGIDPVKFLVVPRLLAMIIMMPVLTVLGEGIGLFSGWLIGVASLHLDPVYYVQRSIDAVEQKDLFSGLLKALVFGAIVGTVGCFYGITVKGGAEGVGKATTKSVVTSLTSMLAMDALLTALIYFS
jgi:phospholipid/cholesterol/gamma-HCH transport system permease protein